MVSQTRIAYVLEILEEVAPLLEEKSQSGFLLALRLMWAALYEDEEE